MAYATREDVRARAGQLAKAWGDDTPVSLADLDLFVRQAAGRIDALLGSRFTLPVSEAAAGALTGLNADMALLLAIPATFPADDRGAARLREETAARSRDEWSALRAGTHEVILLLEATAGEIGGTPGIAYWLEEAPDTDAARGAAVWRDMPL